MNGEAFKQQDKILRRDLKPDLVVNDDIGLKGLPKQSGEDLLEVMMRRYENRFTVMTSTRPLEDWRKLLSDVPTAGAILERFLHHAITIGITGRSSRRCQERGRGLCVESSWSWRGCAVAAQRTQHSYFANQ